MRRHAIPLLLIAIALVTSAHAQVGKWAAPNDSTAKKMIELEGKWAEEVCVDNGVIQNLLADDFQGTGTDGKRYTKADELRDEKAPKASRACQLDEAKVRFFGDKVALIYGAESRTTKQKNGSEARVCQVWTDTWLKRDGKWRIVAAQDSKVDCKSR